MPIYQSFRDNFVLFSYEWHLFTLRQWLIHQPTDEWEVCEPLEGCRTHLLRIMTYTQSVKIITYVPFLSCLAQFGVKSNSDTFRSSFNIIDNSFELSGSFQYLHDIQCFPWSCEVVLYKRLIMTTVTSWRCSCRKKWCLFVNHVQPSTHCTLMLFGTLTVPSICEKLRILTYAGLTG